MVCVIPDVVPTTVLYLVSGIWSVCIYRSGTSSYKIYGVVQGAIWKHMWTIFGSIHDIFYVTICGDRLVAYLESHPMHSAGTPPIIMGTDFLFSD